MGPAEVLKLHEVSVKEFQTLVATGEVKHVAGLAAWARWMSREDEKIMEYHCRSGMYVTKRLRDDSE